ncbi:MAG: efflux RND transporter periplasmic adaptor subunit [Fidelibacterota bacterium]|jgi:HlyD family secretion protein|tara:strand:+ start:319 stop:1566 length:1248 start_codon:yes stop_codon:yes gene_type:complete
MLKLFKNKKVWIPLLIIILSSIIYFFKRMDVEEIYVEAEYIELRDIIHKVNASGRIQPEEEVQITSTITGWITKITVSEGDTVNPGQHLINIDEKQIRQRYNNTLSQVKSSDANLRRVQSQMTRTETLYAQSLISKQELEQIEASYQMALSQSEQANANLLSAEDELSKTQLTSPKYGIVTSITKEEGEMAVGGMFNPGVLMTIADLSRMEVEVDVNENDVVKIEVGDKSEIEIDAYPDSIFYGVVSEIAHTALSANMGMQQQVTNFKVKVKMLSVPNKVRPGMSSTVNIITEIIKSTISIPIQSLTSRPENYKELELNEEKSDENEDDILFKKNKPIDVVFVLVDTFEGEKVPEGKKYALVRPIKVGTSSENFYAIKSGIEVSEIIVTGGYRVLSKELNHGDIVIMNSTLKVQN